MTDATAPALPTYEVHDTIAVITHDDGKANVVSTAVLAELEQLTQRGIVEPERGTRRMQARRRLSRESRIHPE